LGDPDKLIKLKANEKISKLNEIIKENNNTNEYSKEKLE